MRLFLPICVCIVLLTVNSWAQNFLHKDDYANLMSKQLGAKVVRVSTQDSIFTAETAIDDQKGVNGIWRMTNSKKQVPNYMVVELLEQKQLTTFAFRSNDLAEETFQGVSANYVEVFVSTVSSDTGFRKVGEIHLKRNNNWQVIRTEACQAKWVKIEVVTNWGHKKHTEIGRIYAYNDIGQSAFQEILSSSGVLDVHEILFHTGSADFYPQAHHPIQMMANILLDNPAYKMLIEGHTDNVGSHAANLALSEKRAKAVFEQLVVLGVSAEQLKYAGLGSTQPVETNATEEGRAQNRRVTFKLLDK